MITQKEFTIQHGTTSIVFSPDTLRSMINVVVYKEGVYTEWLVMDHAAALRLSKAIKSYVSGSKGKSK